MKCNEEKIGEYKEIEAKENRENNICKESQVRVL
jgi:hypothetical protein